MKISCECDEAKICRYELTQRIYGANFRSWFFPAYFAEARRVPVESMLKIAQHFGMTPSTRLDLPKLDVVSPLAEFVGT